MEGKPQADNLNAAISRVIARFSRFRATLVHGRAGGHLKSRDCLSLEPSILVLMELFLRGNFGLSFARSFLFFDVTLFLPLFSNKFKKLLIR